MLIPSSRKVQAKDTQKASLHTQLVSLGTYWEDWVRANDYKPPIICILSSTRSTSTWSTNLLDHEPFNKPRRNKEKELSMQEHTGSGQGTFSVCFGLFKGMELYVPSEFITLYCHAKKWGKVSMKELEKLPAWWGGGISYFSSPLSSHLKEGGWKSNMQML